MQMHGLVSPEASLKPSYPAIVWLDQRSAAQVSCIYDTLDPACLARHLQNRFYPGYAPPRLLWLHDEATEIYRKIARALCLKDCIRLKLTGNWAANRRMLRGHACITLKNAWFVPLPEALDLDPVLLVRCGLPAETAGAVTKSGARETGLREGIPVICGASDENALLLGNGLISEGKAAATSGSDGVIFLP